MTPEILEVEVNPPALDLVSLAYVLPRILMRHYEALVDLDPLVDMALCDLLLLIYACFGIVLLVFIPSPLFVCVCIVKSTILMLQVRLSKSGCLVTS